MALKERPKPFLLPEYCKGCGRCLDACAKDCITLSDQINPLTGLVPVELDLANCNACGLCMDACPEPYGLRPAHEGEIQEFELEDPAKIFGVKPSDAPEPVDLPSEVLPLPRTEPLVIKGTYASALGALLAGCRHVYGYPITPSTEGAELMAKFLPKLDGTFIQAVSEVATVNMMYGTAGAGLPTMTFTSSPGFSLMLEGVSYMIGAELPGVFVNIMRGGPGLGNIAPEQADIKLACHGLGHGNTQAIVLAPSTPQEMLDLTMLAFELTFKYRNPVILLGDGYLGQMTAKCSCPTTMIKPGIPKWAVYGDAMHRKNLITSIFLTESDLEAHNVHLNAKYDAMKVEARGRILPVRRRRGGAHRLQHPGPHRQGRRAGTSAPGHQGRPLPAHHPLALPGGRAEGRHPAAPSASWWWKPAPGSWRMRSASPSARPVSASSPRSNPSAAWAASCPSRAKS